MKLVLCSIEKLVEKGFENMDKDRLKIGIRVANITIIANAVLSFIKILLGVIATSSAMIADGMHSFSDVVSSIGVIIGMKLSNKKADKQHPYGHERIESLTALFLSIMLFAVAVGIGYSGIQTIINKEYNTPGLLAIVAAFISIATKEWMYFYTIKYAKMINSASLKADAWHHRSDSLSSIGALIGIVGARLGVKILDPIAALIICVLIIKVAFDICRESIAQLIDESASDEKVNEIANNILNIEGVIKIDSLQTRKYATKLYVDVDISVDGSLSVEEGHNIADKVHHTIEKDENIKHCMVHVNPYKVRKIEN